MIQERWKEKATKWRKILAVLIALLLVLSLANLSIGSVNISFIDILKVLGGSELNEATTAIIWSFRIPKVLTAIAVGVGLGISGLQMQTLFRNALAGPFVLGISSGASLGVALLVMGAAYLPFQVSGVSSVLAACIGAFAVFGAVISMASKIRDITSLLIVGLMFGSAVGAVVSVLQYFGDPNQIQSYLVWTFGSLSGVTWVELRILIPIIVLGSLTVFLLSDQLNMLLLGDEYAMSAGLNLRFVRIIIISVTSILAGTITAFCGPIAFIGIAVPHISRLLFNTSNHRLLQPLVCFVGASVMLICDIISQLPGQVATLPINAVTSLVGAPLIIWLIIKRKSLVAF
ncbi:MAG: iron ABC transporter permease [Cyclobacteriaceae bacterium]